jgi:hypothetical protein
MKFEFGDFYKFVVSLGIVLIGLAFLVPWLFLSQPFDLLVETDKLKSLTPSAQSVILQRQQVVQWIVGIIPTFSWVSGILGVILFLLGAVFWWRKSQRFTDQLNELNLELLKRQLKPASAEEIKEKVEETKAEVEEPIEEIQERLLTGLRFDVVEFEGKLQQKLSHCFKDTHEVLSNQRLGSVIFDYVLLAKSPTQSDYVLEIKHLRFGFKFGWLRDNAVKQVFAGALYQKDSNRQVVPVLLVIAPKKLLEKTPTDDYVNKIKKDILVRYSQVTVSFLASEEVDSIECSQLRKLIS